MKKQITILLLVVGMLLGAGGCAGSLFSPMYGSTTLQVVTVSSMAGTATAVTFDKELYKILKDYDWFWIHPEQYMPEPYTE